MIAISVSGGVLVALLIIGALAYLHDGATKVRELQRRKSVQQQLNSDLQAPKPSAQLPYGFGSDSPTEADSD